MKKIFLICFVLFVSINFSQTTDLLVPGNPLPVSATGKLNTICVFIKFSNDAGFGKTRQTYDNYFNSLNAFSLKSFYKEVSYNKLEINTYMYPVSSTGANPAYTFPKPRGYFQEYSAGNTIGYKDVKEGRRREQEILDSAVIYLKTVIPPNLDLDFNNDGFVDNTIFIFNGATSPWADVGLWPHSGVLDSYDERINNKRVYHYSIQIESYANANVFCHETFHVFGAPDLYRGYVSGTPVGYWDIMASGNCSMGAYMKYKYTNKSWITDIPKITKSGKYTLSPLSSDTNNCYRIDSPYADDEFFVLEYRKRSGFAEASMPGEGLLVYRINSKASMGNLTGPPDEVYIYRPNNSTTDMAYFSAQASRTAINDFNTNPLALLSNGSKGGLNIKNIGLAGNTISFDVEIMDCTILFPEQFSSLTKGSNVEIKVKAEDLANVVKVDFFVDNIKKSSDSAYPYSYVWNTSSASAGRHSIAARSIDSIGIYKEANIIVFVSDGNPFIQLTYPADSTFVTKGDTLNVNVLASCAGNKIKFVKYYVDGIQKSVQNSSQSNIVLNSSEYNPGKRIVKATVTDSSGNEASQQVNIYIMKTLLEEGFENNWPPAGWYVNSTIYGWYQSPKGANSGAFCAATRNYHVSGEAILETPEIIVEKNTFLRFNWSDHSLDITKGLIVKHDTTYCEISVDGAPYSLLKFLSEASATPVYKKELIDLTQYTGKKIKIRWRDVSDETLNSEGTALDDVEIIAIPELTGVQNENKTIVPAEYFLNQNFPNPFNPSTTINFGLPRKVKVVLAVYNILGEKITELVNAEMQSGAHIVSWNAAGYPSGIYFCSIKTAEFNQTKKMILIK